MSDTEQADGPAELAKWVTKNQLRITRATLVAMSRVEAMSEALTDLDLVGEGTTKDKIDAIITASRAVLAERMGEAFEDEFSDVSDQQRSSLKKASEAIVREGHGKWADLVIEKYRAEHPRAE